MSYTDNPGCGRCGCVPVQAQPSPPDAKWRTCPCVCHDTPKQLLAIGPTKEKS